VSGEHGSNASLGRVDGELVQLSRDAQVAPPGVLPGEANDELDGLSLKRWSPRSSVPVGPASSHKAAIPVEDRLRRGEEYRPPLAWGEAGERAISARSDQVKRAQLTRQQRTTIWWRKTRISPFFANVSLLANLSAPKARWTSRYRNESATASSLPNPSWQVKAVAGSFWTLQDGRPRIPGCRTRPPPAPRELPEMAVVTDTKGP